MSTWLEEGQSVPDVRLESDSGAMVRLKDLRGKIVVLYFYPRDDTPGCTREACSFRDRSAELKKLGVQVLGVSTDDITSHGKFRDKYELNFPLLADPEHKAAEAFGAWQEKQNYGKKYWGVVRSTFLIDAKGKVRKVWRNVKVDGHDAAVIEAVKELDAPAAEKKVALKKKPAKKRPTSPERKRGDSRSRRGNG